jgi:hypothetical protein
MKSVEAIHSRRCLLLIDWMPAATVELREIVSFCFGEAEQRDGESREPPGFSC